MEKIKYKYEELIALSKDQFANSEVADAMETLLYCQRVFPKQSLAFDLLGDIYFEKEKYQKALVHYLRSISISPNNIQSLQRIGLIELHLKNYDIAEDFLKKALDLDVKNFFSILNMANFYQQLGNYPQALKFYLEAENMSPNNLLCITNIGKIYFNQKNWDKAQTYLERALKMDPESQVIQFLVRFLVRGKNDQLPLGFIEELFDNYSDNFDQHLTETLAYKAPERCVEILKQTILKNNNEAFKILDLGCGTGLLAESFPKKSLAFIDGVDISQKMLNVARAKNIYQKLIKNDILEFLSNDNISNNNGSYDILIACDVFNYLGDLEPLFQQLSKYMSNKSYILFSTENHSSSEFELSDNLRFQHSDKYIQKITTKCGFNKILHSNTILRQQDSLPVTGDIWLLQKEG